MSRGLQVLQAYREKSGLELYRSGCVSPHRNYFKVQSESDPLMAYEVDVEGATCTCKDFESRCVKLHLQCKHQIAVYEYIKNQVF